MKFEAFLISKNYCILNMRYANELNEDVNL